MLSLGVAVFAVRLRRWRDRNGGLDEERAMALHRGFLFALDLQVALGFLLYLLLSPIPRLAFQDLGAAMGDDVLRFFSVEHVFGMTLALIAAHFGYARARSSAETGERRGSVLLAQAVWLIVTLGSIPWPGLPYGRPLLRLLF